MSMGTPCTSEGSITSPASIPNMRVVSILQKFTGEEMKALGVSEIMVGIITIAFGCPMLYGNWNIAVKYLAPWWIGLLSIISGSLAISAEKTANTATIKLCCITNIICAIASLIGVVLFITDIVNHQKAHSKCLVEENCMDAITPVMSMTASLLFFTIVEAIISSVVSAVSSEEIPFLRFYRALRISA
ncbi:membrane-spanning 4-domains subfamily A member 12-like [Latimeria chalumnae]|uniref:membrane-spanning 4-domains subfamily A member 12-like n=1 Tax=Latimeria chalumnae TaxID=7897 RepID=UPI00313D1BA1